MDEEIRKYYHTTNIGFINRYKNLEDRDQRRAKLLKRLLKNKDHAVVAITQLHSLMIFMILFLKIMYCLLS